MHPLRKLQTICFPLLVFFPTLGNCSSPQDLQFDRREFSLFVANLPRWETKELVDVGPNGKLVLLDPKGDGRFVRISWNYGEPLTIEEEKSLISNAGGVIVETFTLNHDARKIAGYRQRYQKSKEVAVSSIYCKETNSTIRVSSFLNFEWQDLLAIHSKIAQSISCLKPTRKNVSQFRYPIFKAGKNRQEINGNIAYSQPDESLFIFTSAMPYARIEEAPNLPAAMEQLVRILLGNQIQLEKITSYSKDARHYIAGSGLFDKQQSHMVAMWWKCPDHETGYFGVYLGPSTANLDRAKSTLATAACP